MYTILWNFITQHTEKTYHVSVFLFLSLVCFTFAGFTAGSLICLIGGMSMITKITVLLCTSGYCGLIFGFFGSIFYLYKMSALKH